MESRKIKFFYDEMLGDISNKFDIRFYNEMTSEDYEILFLKSTSNNRYLNYNKSNINNLKEEIENEKIDDYYLKEITEKKILKTYKIICYKGIFLFNFIIKQIYIQTTILNGFFIYNK